MLYYDTQVIKTIDIYTYLGVILDEHMTFSFCIDSRYKSGSKSLSSIIGMFMEILLMICIPNYIMPVLFQQCYMVLKYLDIYTLVILKKYKKEN